MGTSIRRTAVWLVLAALSIAAAAWMAIGASAANDAGAPPSGTTGELKIIKNLGGQWPDGAFIFTWDCTDGQSGSATFPDDFTGANFSTDEEYPLGTICTVEETDGVLSVSDYDVTTHIESASGFQAINPRDVPINNSTGTNTIQYMNDPIEVEPDPKVVEITKIVDGGPASVSDFQFEIFCDMGDYTRTVTIPVGNSDTFEVPGDLADCKVTESPVTDYAITGDDGVIKQLNPEAPTEWTITNTWIEPEPEVANVTVLKEFGGSNAWEFGFAFACEGFGNADTFALGGGDAQSFEVPFYVKYETLADGNDNGETGGMLCAVGEELLLGDWTVNVSVNGADALNTEPIEGVGGIALFAVHPGDDVTVTFENIAGYFANRPTGIAPEIFSDNPA